MVFAPRPVAEVVVGVVDREGVQDVNQERNGQVNLTFPDVLIDMETTFLDAESAGIKVQSIVLRACDVRMVIPGVAVDVAADVVEPKRHLPCALDAFSNQEDKKLPDVMVGTMFWMTNRDEGSADDECVGVIERHPLHLR